MREDNVGDGARHDHGKERAHLHVAQSETPEEPYTIGDQGSVSTKYTLSDNLWTYLQKHAAKHKKKGNGFGFGLVTPDMISRTLSARYYKDGSEILIHRGERRNPRKLTPRECARLMGFPEKFKIPVSDTQAYRQFGNSVAVPAFKAIADHMAPHIHNQMENCSLNLIKAA